MGEHFKRSYIPTVGADFSYKEIKLQNQIYRLLLWDLAGEEKFRNVRSLYFQGVFGVFLIFDLTSRKSFEVLDKWIEDIETSTPTKGVPIWLVANKKDLVIIEKSPIPESEITNYVNALNAKYEGKFEIGYSRTSAATGENVSASFDGLITNIMQWVPKRRVSG